MARASAKALQQDADTTIPRLALKETGFVGLRTSNGSILAETQRAFRYPAFISVVNEMRNNPTVGAAMNAYRFLMSRPKWTIAPPQGADDILKERAAIVNTMLGDMEDSFESFILSAIPYLEYGYSIHNIVPYRRLYRNGSKYNDGLVGIKKLAIRNQETIRKWVFSEDGRDLLRVEQDIANLEHSYKFANLTNNDGLLEIPRESFLLFTASATAANPQGNSIYKNIYLAHKQLTMLQDQQLLTVAKEAKGMMLITVPPQYLSEDSPDQGAAAAAFRKIIDGHNNGTTAGLLVPQQYDQETKQPMFGYSLLESRGNASANVESIIKGLQNDIAQALSVDVLKLGADGSGSFSLAESKSSILALAVDARLREIKSVLDNHLMRYIFEMNGWALDSLPTFEYGDVEKVDMELFGKFIQQTFSVGAIEFDRDVANRVRDVFGVALLPEDEPVDKEKLPSNMSGASTRAGDGMKSSTGNGTGKDPFNKSDASAANVNNK